MTSGEYQTQPRAAQTFDRMVQIEEEKTWAFVLTQYFGYLPRNPDKAKITT